MSRSLLLILVGIGGIVMDDPSHALYAPPALYAQGAYPRVMSPTGRFYGPTQAHYQYERQYGRPWHGGPAPVDANTGVNFRVQGGWGGYPGYGGHLGYGGFPGYGGYAVYGGNVPFVNSGYGYSIQQQGFPLLGGFGGPVYGGYGGVNVYQNQFSYGPIQQYQYNPQGISPPFGFAPATTFSWQQPDAFQQQQQQPQQPAQGNGFAPQPGNGAVNAAAPPEPVLQRPHAFLPAQPSTAAQRQRSLHLQGQGDVWFRQQNYLQAYSRYKQAAAAASDLAAPRFRMAYALMALQRYELAVPELQRGIRIDPRYPLTGESPQEVYGEENRIAAAALPQAVAAWVKQDIRSSDRLFLLGALLMISGDNVRARVLLETAAQFGAEGPTEHILAFLKLDQPAGDENADVAAKLNAADNRAPVPEAVEQMLKENKNWLPAQPPAKQAQPAPATKVPLPPEPDSTVEDPAVTPDQTPEAPVPSPAAPPTTAPSVAPGFVPIPKKGAPTEPTPAPLPEVEPASLETPQESGPVIPNPAVEK